MPVGTADIVLVRTQVLEKLLAMPRHARYTDAIGENSDYAVLQEITDTILLTDQNIVTEILGKAGHPWRQQFMQWTADIASGTAITKAVGVAGDVKTKIGANYSFSVPAKSREEVLRMIAFPTLYTDRNFHFIEDWVFYTPADFGQVQYPLFTKGVTCQSPQTAESALIYGTIAAAEKVYGETTFFTKYTGLFGLAKQLAIEGDIIPPQEVLEAMLARQQNVPKAA